MISVSLYTEYYIPLLDVTLIIRYMLWDVYRILDEQHVVAPLWRSVCMFSKKKKKKGRQSSPSIL
jgi:hypothetical protein